MLRFKEFIKEDRVQIDVKPEFALSSMDKANEDLEAVTKNPFVNSSTFINAVRGTLERYGIVLPAHSNLQQLSLEGETVYVLGDSGHYVYMVHNLDPNGGVEGYATIVNETDLRQLSSMDFDNDDGMDAKQDNNEPTEWMKYPKARRDDDSGNTDEYA
jgi:hypothetical protein